MNWQPNVGEKPEGRVLIWVQIKPVPCACMAYWEGDGWLDDDETKWNDDWVSHWLKVEAPQ